MTQTHTTRLLLLLIASSGWLFGSNAFAQNEFITTWQTTTASESITIPTHVDETYSYDVDWGDGSISTGETGDATHQYTDAGTYTVSISGTFPRIFFNSFFSLLADAEKIMSIEQWGDIVWTSMEHAFSGCKNLVINATDAPNLSGAISTKFMFGKAEALNSDLNNWDVSTITDMSAMFTGTSIFNGDISDWDVSSVENFASMFSATDNFNNAIGNWDVSSGKNFNAMFASADGFNVNLNNWDMSQATNIGAMFANADLFNQPLNNWNVGNVTNMIQTFLGTQAFNQPIGNWDVSKVNNMKAMFQSAAVFNHPLNDWDVSNVITMESVFEGAKKFNGDISDWNLIKVTNTKRMFIFADDFNQDLSDWNVSTVVLMGDMFNRALSFNSDISQWDVSEVTSMVGMFYSATSFDKDLSDWDVSKVADMSEMFDESGLSTTSYDNILIGWSLLTVQPDVPLGALGKFYCNSSSARAILEGNGWDFTDAGENCRPFKTNWETTSASESITIPTFGGETYNYDVDWGDGSTSTGETGDATHEYAAAGIYTVSISGDFPRIYFNFGGDRNKIISIEQWGDIQWSSMQRAFSECTNLSSSATDAPNLASVTSLDRCFTNCPNYNGEVGNWNTETITEMNHVFFGASSFNQDISNWNTSNVTITQSMFQEASAFNQDISNWDMGNLEYSNYMFYKASSFNQDVSGWNMSKAIFINSMFQEASSFNQDLGGWDVSSATRMDEMFHDATVFNQDLSNWDISNVTHMPNMFDNSGLSTFNYDKILEGWAAQSVQSGVTLGAAGVQYCLGLTARTTLENTNGWTITDGGENCVVNIPDANFKAVLLADPNINTTDDGEITVQEAQAFTGVINANYADVNAVVSNTDGISDVTGLEYFTEVTDVYFNGNAQIEIGSPGITTLDISNNTKLESINCSPCNLTSLDVSSNPDLLLLRVSRNQITGIDVSSNFALQELNVGTNNLTSLDVSSNIDLRRLYFNENNVRAIDVSNAPLLTILNASATSLSALDVSSNTSLTTLRATEIGLNAIDVSQNTQLNTLFLGLNNLVSIDVSNNTLLTDLRVQTNQLTSLDISTNTVLEKLFAGENLLSELNAKNGNNGIITTFNTIDNPNLTCITVDDAAYAEANFTDVDELANFSTDCNTVDFADSNFENALLADVTINTNNDAFIQVVEAVAFTGTIDVSNLSISDLTGIEAFTEITELKASTNSLTEVDVSNNTKLEVLWIRSNALTAIDVSNNVQLTQLFLNGNDISEIDLTNNVLIDDLSLFDNNLSTIDISTLVDLTELSIRGNNLTAIDVSSNTKLTKFYAHSNNLSSLDVTNNPLLVDFYFDNNNISTIDLSNNTLLKNVRANQNNLTVLDLSSNSMLSQFQASNNQLTELNLANGNNSNVTLFDATNNPNLSCITVDDVNYSTSNWTSIDGTSNFSTDCTNIATEILTFTIAEQTGPATINASAHTINSIVPLGTNLSSLTPTLTFSSGASLNPGSGVAQNFANAVNYTVTAENPTITQVWTISVLEENAVPTDLSLTENAIDENNSVGDIIGTLTTTDQNSSDSHTYSLVSGTGDTDNTSFAISGSNLTAVGAFDFETKSSYSVRVQTDDGRGGIFAKSFTVTVNDITGVAQTITFDPIAVKSATDATFDIVATSDSGLPVNLAITGPATLSNNTVTLSGTAGDIVITATNAGNTDYASASATLTVSVSKVDQTITLDAIESKVFGEAPFDLSGSSNSSLPLTYTVVSGPATLIGGTMTLTGAGTVVISASQDGNDTYNSATVEQTITVAKAEQTITLTPIESKVFGEADFELSATASSGLDVTYSIVSGPATISGATVSLTGAGEVMIEANQVGDDNFNAATPVSETFTVDKSEQTLTFETPSSKLTTDAPFDVIITSSSGLTPLLTVNGPATVLGSTITLTGDEGTVTVTASQPGDENYNAATSVDVSFDVVSPQESQNITFTEIEDQYLEDGSVILSATASSGLEVTYEIIEGPATLGGTTLTFTGLGEVTVEATQQGNEAFFEADPVQITFEIISITGLNTIDNSKISIYPNPTQGQLTLEMNLKSVNELSVYDLNGIKVFNLDINKNIDVSSLNPGLYFLLIRENSGKVNQLKFNKK